MKKTLLFIICITSYFHAQSIEDKELLKKCRKEFSKKICLSDEDQDNIPFYLDKCPKQLGSNQDNGCPVQAILRKDTAETAELDDIIQILPSKFIFKGCGQIINIDSLKLNPKTK